jgi:hypothetical protein
MIRFFRKPFYTIKFMRPEQHMSDGLSALANIICRGNTGKLI